MKIHRYLDRVMLEYPPDGDPYWANIPAVRQLLRGESMDFDRDVTIMCGENGTGKSTLLEAIAIAYGFNPEGGTVNFNFSTMPSHSDLCDTITLAKSKYSEDGFFLRAESYYNVASQLYALSGQGEDDRFLEQYGGLPHEMSHGESFLTLVQTRFSGHGLYLLDEPEAALSPRRILTLMGEIQRLVRDGSQFIISTHSPLLTAYPDARIYQLDENGFTAVAWQETDCCRVMKQFFDDPSAMLSQFHP